MSERGSQSASSALLAGIAEDLRRDVAPSLTDAIDKATKGRYRYFWHNLLFIRCLVDVALGRCKRLMVFMPPRHGKSMTLALFCAYYLRYNRGKKIIYSCYGDNLAKNASRLTQRYFKALGGQFLGNAERANLNNWVTDTGGGMKVGGIGSGLTGEGGDVLILDDSVKDAKTAQSAFIQQNNWEWFMSTFMTRTNPDFDSDEGDGASVILVQTLWSEQDIPERVTAIEREMAADPDMEAYLTPWTVLCFPAVYQPGLRTWPQHFTVIADERKAGEPLCEKIMNLASLLKRKAMYFARGVAWQWEALFQQNTVAPEGVYIRSDWVKPYVKQEDIPKLSRWFRGWDLAFTADGGDRTVSLLCAIDENRIRYVIPTTSEQCSPSDVRDLIMRVARTDDPSVTVGIERAHAGLAIIDDLKREGPLKGKPVYESVPTRDKVARASNWISLARAGRIKVVADTPSDYLLADELIRSWTGFKGEDGDFDDWVDAMSVVDEMVSKVLGERPTGDETRMTPLEYFNFSDTITAHTQAKGRTKPQSRTGYTRARRGR